MKMLLLGDISPTVVTSPLFKNKDVSTLFNNTPSIFKDKDFVFADNVKPIVIPLPTRHPMLWHIYFEILLPIYIRLYKIDVFFSPEGYIPTRVKTPKLCTIHDINFEHEKTYIGNRVYQRYMEYFTPRFAKSANVVLTVSEFSKQDIATTYKIDENKIFIRRAFRSSSCPIVGLRRKRQCKKFN